MNRPYIHSAVYYPLGSHFLTKNEVNLIEKRLKDFPLENISYGDAGELNRCFVGRLVEDLPNTLPKILNPKLSPSILNFFKTTVAKEFFSDFLDKSYEQTIRRCQFNLLEKDSFIGRHLDTDSNPDYQIACVLQLGRNYSGGEFLVYPDKNSNENEAQKIKAEYGSLTISYCDIEHEVRPVLCGIRTSLVAFISTYDGINKRTD